MISLLQVEVRTGDIPAADTDADINIDIVGVIGSTGKRSLKSLAKDPDEVFQLVSNKYVFIFI